MKLKHYLGALLMAGSVVAISFPADANPGIRFYQRFCKRYAAPLAKITIIKPNLNRRIGLICRDQAKLITDDITIPSKVLLSISTPDITSQSPQLAIPPSVVASPPSVVPTQPTGSEQEGLKQDIIYRSGIAVGGTITVSSGTTVVYLNSQNGNSERTPSPSSLKQIMMELHTGDSKKISERIPIRSPFKQTIVEIILFLI
ncbi:hypothetical protein [Microcoleus vaginatus]|uniref:hypothetical protein n=1 Tax=Microcoleus vaginatus TaxID=119532 RepID=UPI0016822B22|nr:hypothetical protein [Microcoleus sp. FACHB-84]MBD2011761.1 hypothetical protein [Microcoleus sp. FACHB-45]